MNLYLDGVTHWDLFCFGEKRRVEGIIEIMLEVARYYRRFFQIFNEPSVFIILPHVLFADEIFRYLPAFLSIFSKQPLRSLPIQFAFISHEAALEFNYRVPRRVYLSYPVSDAPVVKRRRLSASISQPNHAARGRATPSARLSNEGLQKT